MTADGGNFCAGKLFRSLLGRLGGSSRAELIFRPESKNDRALNFGSIGRRIGQKDAVICISRAGASPVKVQRSKQCGRELAVKRSPGLMAWSGLMSRLDCRAFPVRSAADSL